VHPRHKLTGPEEEEKEKNTGLLHNKPKDKVYHGHKQTGPEKEEKEKNSGLMHNKHKLKCIREKS
jgi:hypothetical protein